MTSVEKMHLQESDLIGPSVTERVLIPAVMIVGLFATATCTVLLGYGAAELLKTTVTRAPQLAASFILE